MLKLSENKGTIYRAAPKGNMVTASMQTGKKLQDGTWENMWWNVKFVGRSKDLILTYPDKTKIKIVSGNVEFTKYNEKFYTNVIVFEYEILDSMQPVQQPEEDEGDLPF